MESNALGPRNHYGATSSSEPASGQCRICGDTEPFHVHNGDFRIEDYFVVGRGQTDFQAAQAWKKRALRAEKELNDRN